MKIYKSLGNIEVDYEKKEVRAGGRRIGFGMISHYEFEHVQTEHSNYETMRVCGNCDELPDNRPLSVTMPKPHEIKLLWELPQGKVGMNWDGFNYTRGAEPNQPRGDGKDYVKLELWDCSVLEQTRDEEYYRSLVD